MTNRHAPRTCFGSGLPPFGSAVFAKSRLALYFFRPISFTLTADYADETGFVPRLDVRDATDWRASRHRRYDISDTEVSVLQNTLRFAGKRLADEVASKPANNDVLAEFRNFSVEEIFDRHIRIFDEALFEQTDRAVKFVELSIDNFLSHVRRLAFHLRLVDFALGLNQFSGHVLTAHVERVRRRDVQRDVFDEAAEIFVLGHEIGLAIDFNQHANFALQMNIRGDDALLGHARRLLARARDSFGSQNRFRFGEVATGFGQSAFAIHHSRVRFFAELLDQLWINIGHNFY